MVIDMNEVKHVTLAQVREFLAGTADVGFQAHGEDAERYRWIARILRRFGYGGLDRADRGLILRYLQRMTGYSRQQVTRLVRQYVQTGGLRQRYGKPRAGFAVRYTPGDVELLAEVDTLHNTLSGPATAVLLRRAWQVYGDCRFERLAAISVSHLYNLRQRPRYQARRRHFTKTRPTVSAIGVRRAPQPQGRPGFIRIDTVHQGDQDGVKGLYHINAVDCVTQWEIVASCEKISEAFLLPVLGELLAGFPFAILGVHSDNGSEYVNGDVARLLEKLRAEFTRSRPRHSNDNGLAETKNGAIVRKVMGYSHIPQRFAARVNTFYREHLNPYVNLHRPSFFAHEKVDAKGKVRKTYPPDLIMTPLDRLASLPKPDQYLNDGVTLSKLQDLSKTMTDNEAAGRVNAARTELFQFIQRRSRLSA